MPLSQIQHTIEFDLAGCGKILLTISGFLEPIEFKHSAQIVMGPKMFGKAGGVICVQKGHVNAHSSHMEHCSESAKCIHIYMCAESIKSLHWGKDFISEYSGKIL